MSEKTLNDYIPLLRTVQQDYIVECVKRYTDRVDFHRGLLPFLPAEEAARCLQFQLEDLKAAQNNRNDLDQVGKALLGEKFIRQTISIFRTALIYRLSEDEATEVIHLNTVKLKKLYGTRFASKFYIRLSDMGMQRKKPIDGMYELHMVSRNQWKVTGHKGYLNAVTEYLHDCCSL